VPGCQMLTGASHVLRWVNGKHPSSALRVIFPPALTLCMQQLYKKATPSPWQSHTHTHTRHVHQQVTDATVSYHTQ